MDYGPIVRILLRVVAGAIMSKGYFDQETVDWISTDPDISMYAEMGLGFVVLSCSEFYYFLAKKFGWRT